MTPRIEQLLDQAEGACLECKQLFPEKADLAAILCSFANTAGGDLIIGVSDKKPREVVGVPEDRAVDLEQKISSIAATAISPAVSPFIRLMNLNGRCVLAVHVEQGYQRPYEVIEGKARGTVFIRIGSSTRKADAATRERLRLQSSGLSWDALPCLDVRIEDLAPDLVEDFLETRKERRNLPLPGTDRMKWMMKTRMAVETGGQVVPTRAGVLLFHPHPGEVLPQSGLEMARFKGAEAQDFLDKRSVDAPAWKLYDEALAFFRRHLPVGGIRTAAARKEKLAYPELAFREFMINALCHRSYEPGTGSVKLAIFDDTIEITNSGPLPEGLELADLGTGISVLRNPVLARAFNELGLIEGWGTGVRLALRHLAEYRLPPATILQRGFFTQVSSVWRWSTDLRPYEKTILEFTAAHGKISSRDVVDLCGCSERAARDRLRALVKRGFLHKTGNTKGVEYTLG